jgi:hypothetical protein
MGDLIWGFAAWVTFLLVNRVASLYWAAAAGVVVALIVLVRAWRRHRVHLFEVAGVVFFGGLSILLVAIQPGDLGTWARYVQAVAHGSLTLIVFGSVLVGSPFTEPYAREQAPKEVWDSPYFHALNRRISLVWGLAFLVGTISLSVAGASGSRQILLRVVVPFGALALAFKYSQKQADVAGEPEADQARA